jgi:hypothetical protein
VLRPRRRQFWLHWGYVFGGSMALFLLRFLVPSPVGLADGGDGPRLMCGLGVAPVTGGHVRYDAYAYFRYAIFPSACAHSTVYQSSQHLLLVAAQWLTPVLGLSGKVNLIALGVLTCALAAAAIASLACGFGVSIRSRLVVAGVLWLVLADAAFFDTFASPYSEGATLAGLVLVAAGLAYLGRGGWASAAGVVMAGAGGYLSILSKEQYLVLIVPVIGGLIMAAMARDGRRGIDRLLTGQMAAAVILSGLLAAAAVSYVSVDASSPYTRQLHQEQVVDVVFGDIITRADTTPVGDAYLRDLGLPTSWAQYAGDTFWARHSVYYDPLWSKYAGKFTDANLTHFLVTHPIKSIEIAQSAAVQALDLRVTYLGNYAPGSKLPPGSLENRVQIISSIEGAIPAMLGLFWLIPLWTAMLALAVVTLRRPRRSPWHHDAAVVVMCLTGCAIAAFIPAAFFAGVETTRHMMGSNMATALAFTLSVTLLGSLLRSGLAQGGGAARSRMSVPFPRDGNPRDGGSVPDPVSSTATDLSLNG